MKLIALLSTYLFPIALIGFILYFVMKAAVKSAINGKFEEKSNKKCE